MATIEDTTLDTIADTRPETASGKRTPIATYQTATMVKELARRGFVVVVWSLSDVPKPSAEQAKALKGVDKGDILAARTSVLNAAKARLADKSTESDYLAYNVGLEYDVLAADLAFAAEQTD